MAFNLTGIEVSLDLAIIGSIIVALITWKTTKDKELNEQKKKEKAEMQRLGFEYIKNLRESLRKLISFREDYQKKYIEEKNAHLITEDEKKEIQEKNADLITEYKNNLNDFLFNCGTYGLKDFYSTAKESINNFNFAKENGNIELVVLSGVKVMYEIFNLLNNDEKIADIIIRNEYGLTKEQLDKKIKEFKEFLENNNTK